MPGTEQADTCLAGAFYQDRGSEHRITVDFERRCFSLESLFADLCPRACFF